MTERRSSRSGIQRVELDAIVISIQAASHYLHVVGDDERLPPLDARLAPLCRERFRRIDRFIQLALLGSAECAIGHVLAPDCALYICSGIGPVGNNIVVQEAIVGARALPTPFHFVNTLGSSAGYYVARNLALAGQSLFISRRGDGLDAGLTCAAADLASGAVSRALLGFVEECTVPRSAHRARQQVPPNSPVAEGSHWLLLERRERVGRPEPVIMPDDAHVVHHDSADAARVTRHVAGAADGMFGFVAATGRSGWQLVRFAADGVAT